MSIKDIPKKLFTTQYSKANNTFENILCLVSNVAESVPAAVRKSWCDFKTEQAKRRVDDVN